MISGGITNFIEKVKWIKYVLLIIILTLILSYPIYAATGDEWISKGDKFFSQEDYNGAIKAYDEAISINSSDGNAWSKKGKALEALGKNEEAIQVLDKYIAINPDNADVWLIKGYALGSLKQYESEIQAYDRVIALDPNHAYVWVNKGFAFDELGRYYEAIEAYDRAIAINPNDSMAWNNKGLSLNNLRRYNEAIIAFDRAIAINPNYSVAWNNKFSPLFELGRYYEAFEAREIANSITSTRQDFSKSPRQSPILLLFIIIILAILIRKDIITHSGVTKFLEKVKGILLKPSKTFDAFRNEKLSKTIKFLIIISIIYSSIFALITEFVSPIVLYDIGLSVGIIGTKGLIPTFVTLSLFLVIITFLGGAFSHIFVYAMGGRKGVTQTIKASMYASTPWLIIGWLPYLGDITWLWGLVLMIIGIRQLQEISTRKAVLAIFLPFIILIVFALIMGSFFYFWGWSPN